MTNKILKSTLLLLTAASLTAANGAALTMSRIPEASAPKIDGIIEDAEWSDAAALSRFCVAGTEKLSPNPVETMIKYDAENLYFAFRSKVVFEPIFEPTSFDSLDYYTVDSIDLSMVPPGVATWMKFGFERAGGKTDLRVAGQVRLKQDDWNPAWTVKSRLLPLAYMAGSVWEAEVAIPWSTLELKPVKGMEIPLQICRHFGNMRKSEDLATRTSSWAMVGSIWGLLNPESFGQIILGGKEPVFRFASYSDFAAGQGGFSGRMTAADEVKVTARIWDWTNYEKVFLKEDFATKNRNIDVKKQITVEKSTPSLMDWQITDSVGVVAKGRVGTDLDPVFKVDFAPIYTENKVKIIGDISRIKHLPANLNLIATLSSADKKNIATKTVPLQSGARFFEESLELQKVSEPNEVTVTVKLADAANRVLYSAQSQIKQLPPAEWLNRAVAEVTAPFGPWKPVTLHENQDSVAIDILKNQYLFGKNMLPEKVMLQGENFSAAPFEFVVETDQGKQLFQAAAPLKVVKKDARGVTLAYQGESQQLLLIAQILVEFDGLAWYDVKLANKPGEKATVKSLSVSMPLLNQHLRYMRGLNAMATLESASYFAMIGKGVEKNPRELAKANMPFVMELSTDNWKYQSNFNNFYWLGDEDRGMYVILPSRKNLFIKNEFSSTRQDDKNFVMDLNLIDTPTEITTPLEYEFGLMLTPSKELKNPAALRKIGAAFTGWNADGSRTLHTDKKIFDSSFGWRFFHDKELKPYPKDYFTTAMLTSWTMNETLCGNPNPPEAEMNEIAKQAKLIKSSIGGSPMLWYDSMLTMPLAPKTVDYQFEIERYPMTRLMVERFSSLVCPTDAWMDFYLSGAKRFLDMGVESIYMDMSVYGPCSNRFHGCGYRDKDGNVQGVIPFLKGRELFLRLANLVKSNHPDAITVIHGTPISPIANWVDVVTYGEEWTTAPDYSTLSPEFYQLCLTGTESIGTPISFFPGLILTFYLQAQNSAVTLGETAGLVFMHNESMWNGVEAQLPGLRLIWDAQNEFGIDGKDVQYIPYFRNEWSEYPDGVAVSSWKRGNEQLAILFNVAYMNQSFDLAKFNAAKIEDMIRRETLPVSGKIELKGRDFRLLRIQ